MTKAFDIQPAVRNARQVIGNILLTMDGNYTNATGIYLDGSGGNAYFAGTLTGTTLCLAGDDCITNWPTGGGSESLRSETSSNIYYTSGNVGIGDSTPTYKLDVKGGV